MNIFFVNPGGNSQGGAERSLALLIRELNGRGHVATVGLLSEGDAGSLFETAGAEVLDLGTLLTGVRRHGSRVAFLANSARSVPDLLTAAAVIRSASRQRRADLIHSNGFRSHILAPLLAVGGLPQVWSLRDSAPSRLQRRSLRLAASGAAAIAANSAFTAAQIRPSGRRLVEVVWNPVELSALPAQALARARLGLPSDRKVVAVVAHLHHSKGHHIAIDSLAELSSLRPVLAIAGGSLYGEASVLYAQELRERVTAAGLQNDVRFLGGVPDIGDVYAAADAIVVPSLHPEGFGRVVVEAQLARVPVVATALGGVLELIDPGVTGLLVPFGQPGALAAALTQVLSSRLLSQAVSDAGFRSAQRFAPGLHADAMEQLYARVLS